MKSLGNPFEIRLALQRRFPGWTQPFWTYLTSLRPPGSPRKLRWTQGRHLAVWLAAYIASAGLAVSSAAALIDSLGRIAGI